MKQKKKSPKKGNKGGKVQKEFYTHIGNVHPRKRLKKLLKAL